MAKIYVNRDGVSSVSSEIKKYNKNVEARFNKVCKKVEKLPDYWKGKQAYKANENFSTIKKQFIQDACIVVDNYVQSMERIAGDYELTEKKNVQLVCKEEQLPIKSKHDDFQDAADLRNKFK